MKDEKIQSDYQDKIEALKEHMGGLVSYCALLGKEDPRLESIVAALDDTDPFVNYSASVAASFLLDYKTQPWLYQ